MGWERKRGKLEEFNRLLRGATDTSFALTVGDLAELRPGRATSSRSTPTPAAARRGPAAGRHARAPAEPAALRRRAGGGSPAATAILQPRVSIDPDQRRPLAFARIFTGNTGLDPYTTAVSDVYQDLFGEGSYFGKGIYDVDAFAAALAGALPENPLLSHDLIEGIFARVGLATDIELLDDYPVAATSSTPRRQHRWVRGDWQLLPWLLPYVPRRPDAQSPAARRRWKILDNLRRSLLAPAIVAAAGGRLDVLPGRPIGWSAAGALDRRAADLHPRRDRAAARRAERADELPARLLGRPARQRPAARSRPWSS